MTLPRPSGGYLEDLTMHPDLTMHTTPRFAFTTPTSAVATKIEAHRDPGCPELVLKARRLAGAGTHAQALEQACLALGLDFEGRTVEQGPRYARLSFVFLASETGHGPAVVTATGEIVQASALLALLAGQITPPEAVQNQAAPVAEA